MHRHLGARGVGDPHRVGAIRLLVGHATVALVAQQVVPATGDHHVHVGEICDQRHLFVHVLKMADQDDLVYSVGGQLGGLRGHRRQHCGDYDIARTRDVPQPGGHGADNPDPLAAGFDHHAGGEQAVGHQLGEGRLTREIEVGGEEWNRRRKAFDEPGGYLRSQVEVVVAQRHRVVEAAECHRIVERGILPGERHAQFLGGQEIVAGGEGDHRPAGLGLQLLHKGRSRKAGVLILEKLGTPRRCCSGRRG